MSTRGMIVRLLDNGKDQVKFAGVYQHWDSYPDGLGKLLYDSIKNKFGGNLSAFLTYAIDQHPAGWSSFIVRAPGELIEERGQAVAGFSAADQHCYCHGWRHEEPGPVDGTEDLGMEWGYALDEASGEMLVLERVYITEALKGAHATGWFGAGPDDSKARWQTRARFNLESAPEPNWKLLQ